MVMIKLEDKAYIPNKYIALHACCLNASQEKSHSIGNTNLKNQEVSSYHMRHKRNLGIYLYC